MTTTEPTPLRINGAAELLAAVPHLLGFHPDESLVLVGLAHGVLVVTARLDLADACHDNRHLLIQTVEAMVRGGTQQVIGAIYTGDAVGDDLELPHRDLADNLKAAMQEVGVELVECLLITGGRWWSYTCANVDCCPAEGRAMPSEPTVFQAEATYAGLAVAPSRAALAEQLLPLPDRDVLTVLINDAQAAGHTALTAGRLRAHERGLKRAIFAAARAATAGTYPTDADAAHYGAALSSIAIRDAIWMAIDERRLSGSELWLNFARRLPSPYDAPALFLFGWHSWRAGNGALASIAAERAIASDPGYSAAYLLLAALTRGVDPRRMPKLRVPAPGGDDCSA